MRRSTTVTARCSTTSWVQPPQLQLQPLWRRTATSPEDAGVGSGTGVAAVAAPHGPAVLTVRRTDGQDAQDRQVYISLDGDEWGTLYYGKELTCEIAPGHHRLKANNTLVRHTVEFDVTPGEHVRFQCINKTHWTGMLFMAFLGAAVLTVKLVREPHGA